MDRRYAYRFGLAATVLGMGLIVNAMILEGKKTQPATANNQLAMSTVEGALFPDRFVMQGVSNAEVESILDRLMVLEQNVSRNNFTAEDSLELRIELLEQELRTLRRALENRAVTDSVFEDAIFDDRSADFASIDTHTGNMLEYEQQFWSESKDMEWTRTVKAAAEHAVATGELEGVHVESVNCHQSACQIELVHLQAIDENGLNEAIYASDLLKEEFYAESFAGNDGELRTRVYVARPGQQIFEKEQ